MRSAILARIVKFRNLSLPFGEISSLADLEAVNMKRAATRAGDMAIPASSFSDRIPWNDRSMSQSTESGTPKAFDVGLQPSKDVER